MVVWKAGTVTDEKLDCAAADDDDGDVDEEQEEEEEELW